MYETLISKIHANGPQILNSMMGAILALIAAAILAAAKKKVFGGFSIDVTIDGESKDSEPISAKDGELMLKFGWQPWWWILIFGGTPTLRWEREVRQILQSAVTPYGNVTADVRDATRIDRTQRRLVVELQEGVNFQRRAAPKPPPAK